jgi:hypothetical protein
MPYSSSPTTASSTARPSSNPEGTHEDMEIKIKGLVRRQLVYGFEAEKDAEGQIVGSSVVKLARRNAFELVGLKRPALAPAWRWKMG